MFCKKRRVIEALQAVDLKPPESFIDIFPHQLSGGQRQRVAIAAALVLKPKFLIADEPVSMLDASVSTDILNLIINIKRDFELTYLFITHDLAIARQIGDRIAVLYLGKIMEIGEAQEITDNPLNPYTKALVSVVPVPDNKREKIILKGEIPNSFNIEHGCKFQTRCFISQQKCRVDEPILREIRSGHFSACHFAEQLI